MGLHLAQPPYLPYSWLPYHFNWPFQRSPVLRTGPIPIVAHPHHGTTGASPTCRQQIHTRTHRFIFAFTRRIWINNFAHLFDMNMDYMERQKVQLSSGIREYCHSHPHHDVYMRMTRESDGCDMLVCGVGRESLWCERFGVVIGLFIRNRRSFRQSTQSQPRPCPE